MIEKESIIRFKQQTRFMLTHPGREYEQLAIVDTLVPNLTKGSPVNIHGTYYGVRLIETTISEDGYIDQFVALKGPYNVK